MPMTANAYAYGLDNPLAYTDPSGHLPNAINYLLAHPRDAFSLAIQMIPFVGDAYGILMGTIGFDPITGASLSPAERLLFLGVGIVGLFTLGLGGDALRLGKRLLAHEGSELLDGAARLFSREGLHDLFTHLGSAAHDILDAGRSLMDSAKGWLGDMARTIQLKRLTVNVAGEIKGLVTAGDRLTLERLTNAPGWVGSALKGSERDLGNLIDRLAKTRASGYRFLEDLEVTPLFKSGADFKNSITGRTWDITTQWSWIGGSHQLKYPGVQPLLCNYQWGPGQFLQYLFKW